MLRTTSGRHSGRLSVYVHVPFCRAKCCYCDFASFAGRDAELADYTEAVCREAGDFWTGFGGESERSARIATVYIGGGTPTLLSREHLARIIEAAAPPWAREDGAEVTIEANPGTVDADALRDLVGLGINRLSLGVQSLDDEMLRRLGRIHTAAQAREAVHLAREAGFDNVSLDFIYGLPYQSIEHWHRTLDEALALRPDHLSLYALTVEEGTPLDDWVERGAVELPNEDDVAEMYELAEDTLSRAGFIHYEISNWAMPGKESRHNLVYWANEEYVGFGAAAHSYVAGHRRANYDGLSEYMAYVNAGRPPTETDEVIGPEMEMAETMMLGLRRMAGVSREYFRERFGRSLDECYASALAESRKMGLLADDGERIHLTPRGRLLGNEVFRRFLPL